MISWKNTLMLYNNFTEILYYFWREVIEDDSKGIKGTNYICGVFFGYY